MSLPTLKLHEWHRDGFLCSTDPSLVDLKALNAAFASEEINWAKPLPEDELKVMLERSVCFGIYAATEEPVDTAVESGSAATEEARPGLVGFARLVTDCVTAAWLTDVYVLPEYQRRGLGVWLIECIKEWWDGMPNGRRLSFVAREGKHEEFYAKGLGSARVEDDTRTKGYRVFSARGKGTIV